MKNLLPTLLAAPLTSLVLPAQAQDMVQWQNIVISAPENLEDTATALAELLIPLTEGNVSFSCNNRPISPDCTRIELSERLGPAFAYVAWPEQEYSCIRLILCSSEQKLHNMDRRCCKTENCRSFCEADANKIAKLVIGGSGSGGRDDLGHKRDY